MPTKFKVDQRNNSLSASVRSGKISQKEALETYNKPPFIEKGLIEYTQKRLGLSSKEFQKIMEGPIRHWVNFDLKKGLNYFGYLQSCN